MLLREVDENNSQQLRLRLSFLVPLHPALASGVVMRMVRGGAELVTVDDAGKALRWICTRGTNGASMLRQAARLVRLAERGVPTWRCGGATAQEQREEQSVWQATGTGSESSDDTAIAVGKEGLPVVHVGLDLQPGATRLAVHSVGRDSVLRFWDRLLGANARNTALDGREEAFCEYRQLRAMVCTWNVGAAKANTLFDHTNGGNVAGNRKFLDDLVRDAQAPEIVVFGFQEVVDLDDRAVTAKTVLLGKNKPKSNGTAANGNTVLTEVESHITPRYRAWPDAMARALARALPGTPYAVVAVQQLVGLFSVAFVRRDQMGEGMGLRDVAVSVVKRGLGGRWGNKGAVAVRFVLDDSSICLVNCHLAAGQNTSSSGDIAAILEDRAALPVSSGDGYDQDGDLRSPGGGAVAAVFALRVRRVDWQWRERKVRKATVEQHTCEQEMMEAVWHWEGVQPGMKSARLNAKGADVRATALYITNVIFHMPMNVI
ncbi:Endonuclease/exonuclease/phosphatase [Auriculariales sp. MPI-PUGE-AT-0066]|nr:Endonuclease/exonuclease/phosphatase [Auriculariales sp. MPI-PUGE-AT-0066]